MPFSSLDLTLDPASDDAVRTGWRMLEDLRIPSEGRRASPTHRPHLTLFTAQVVSPEVQERATAELTPLLPMRLTSHATVVFGRGPFVVAHLVAPHPALQAIEARLRAVGDSRPWIPHLTLSRKVPLDRLNDALKAAETIRPSVIILDHLRHWDPECRTVSTLI